MALEEMLKLAHQTIPLEFPSNSYNAHILAELSKTDYISCVPVFSEALKDARLFDTAMYELIEIAKYSSNIFVLLEKLIQNIWENLSLESTRILVEIGKLDFSLVIAPLKIAIESDSDTLRWIATQELIELIKINPGPFLSLAHQVIKHADPNLRWMMAVGLIFASEKHPNLIQPELLQCAHEQTFTKRLFAKSTYSNLRINDCSDLFELAFNTDEIDLLWDVILELIEFLPWYPEQVIPLFRKAATHHDPNIQWIALLQLFKLASTHPNNSLLFLKDVLFSHDYLLSTSPLHERVLILLGKLNLSYYEKIFELAFQSNNDSLRFMTLFELTQICRNDYSSLSKLLDKFSADHYYNKDLHILVELGKKQPELVTNIFQYAISSNNIQLQTAALAELLDLTQMP